jgi:hypothetical protein
MFSAIGNLPRLNLKYKKSNKALALEAIAIS